MKIASTAWKETIVAGARELDIHVRPGQVDQFARHASILKEWNQKINLTTIVDPLEMAIKHFLDAVLPCYYIQPASRILDVGSGAGFPGVALKVMIPTLQVTLVEAKRKKVNFLKHVIRELGLTQIEAVQTRIENLNQHCRVKFDVIVSRAFSDLHQLIRLTLPYLAASGQIIAYKAKVSAAEIRALRETIIDSISNQRVLPPGTYFQIKTLTFNLPVLNLPRTVLFLRCCCPRA